MAGLQRGNGEVWKLDRSIASRMVGITLAAKTEQDAELELLLFTRDPVAYVEAHRARKARRAGAVKVPIKLNHALVAEVGISAKFQAAFRTEAGPGSEGLAHARYARRHRASGRPGAENVTMTSFELAFAVPVLLAATARCAQTRLRGNFGRH